MRTHSQEIPSSDRSVKAAVTLTLQEDGTVAVNVEDCGMNYIATIDLGDLEFAIDRILDAVPQVTGK